MNILVITISTQRQSKGIRAIFRMLATKRRISINKK
jgi:hypothetical protein